MFKVEINAILSFNKINKQVEREYKQYVKTINKTAKTLIDPIKKKKHILCPIKKIVCKYNKGRLQIVIDTGNLKFDTMEITPIWKDYKRLLTHPPIVGVTVSASYVNYLVWQIR